MRIVVKLGTKLLTKDSGTIDKRNIRRIVREIGGLLDSGHEVMIITSGAIGAGCGKMKYNPRRLSLIEKQALASIGQTDLMDIYKKAFGEQGRAVAQLLITANDMTERQSYLNIRNTLNTLLKMKVVPVINENDSVAVDEIKFGDNDHLASIITIKVDADKLLILTDVDGLLDNDGKLIKKVDKVTSGIKQLAGGAGSDVSVGGMITKVEAAQSVMRLCSADTYLINGRKTGLLAQVIKGDNPGTLFTGKRTCIPHRKRWINLSSSLNSGKSIVLDAGAVSALVERNSSILPVGVKKVMGRFNAGASVSCIDNKGREIARGLVNYCSADINKIMGKRSSEIKKILGVKDYDEVIHKDNLILLNRLSREGKNE
ncbi:MAG: glutamate 5-kinase [Elusimicrobiota bacterium]